MLGRYERRQRGDARKQSHSALPLKATRKVRLFPLTVAIVVLALLSGCAQALGLALSSAASTSTATRSTASERPTRRSTSPSLRLHWGGGEDDPYTSLAKLHGWTTFSKQIGLRLKVTNSGGLTVPASSLQSLPSGSYELSAWTGCESPVKVPFEVRDGVPTDINVVFPLPDPEDGVIIERTSAWVLPRLEKQTAVQGQHVTVLRRWANPDGYCTGYLARFQGAQGSSISELPVALVAASAIVTSGQRHGISAIKADLNRLDAQLASELDSQRIYGDATKVPKDLEATERVLRKIDAGLGGISAAAFGGVNSHPITPYISER